jgi:hypothetical protein
MTVTMQQSGSQVRRSSRHVVSAALALATGDSRSARDELFAPSFRAYGPGRHIVDGRQIGPDTCVSVEAMDTRSDRVVTRAVVSTGEANQRGAEALIVHRVQDGRITEAWATLRWR